MDLELDGKEGVEKRKENGRDAKLTSFSLSLFFFHRRGVIPERDNRADDEDNSEDDRQDSD